MESADFHKSEEAHVGRAAGVVGFFTFLSRVLGLVRDMVLASFFGSGMAADAFFVAFRIPNLLRRLFAEGSLTIAFIPVFTEYLAAKSKSEAFELARIVLTLLSLILAVITVLGILCAPWIVNIQAWGFGQEGDKFELTVLLTRITFPYIFFVSIVAFFMGVLNSLKHFATPAAAPIFLNVGIIGGAFLLSPLFPEPVIGVAVGVLVGGFLQVCLQLPWVFREGLKLFPQWRPFHPAVKRIGLLMLPAIFGSAVYQLNTFVITLLASFLPEGSVAWLYYADRLVQFPLGVFAIAISTAVLPSLSKQAAEKAFEPFGDTLNYALRLVLFITLPSMAGLILLREPIITVFFQRGAFDSQSTLMTSLALMYYTTGLWAVSGIRIVVAAFYALQDTKTPVIIATIALISNLVFSLILMQPLKHGGLALALSLSSALQFILLVLFLRKKVRTLNLQGIAWSAAKAVLAALIMGTAILFLSLSWLKAPPGASLARLCFNLAILIGTGVLIYFGTARILRCSELASISQLFRPITRRFSSDP